MERQDDRDAGAGGPHCAPDAPEGARQLFGQGIGLAVHYADLLAGPGVQRGLIGPREVDRLWERHLLNCAVVADLLPSEVTVHDVGSGGGLPGVPLAIARPDLRIILVEPLLRRTTFLSEVVQELALKNVRVVRARAEDLRGQVRSDVVTARAVAPLSRLAGWGLPLLRSGGEMLALKGDSAETELEQSLTDLQRLGAVDWGVVQVGAGIVDPLTTVVRVRMGEAARLQDATRRPRSVQRSRAKRPGRPGRR